MDIEKMRYFRIVAQEEHMTRAAQKINITQPSLSSIISNMESELGVKLFERVGRQIVLNKYGKVFYEGIDAMLDSYDSIMEKLAAMKDENTSDVKVAVTGLNFPRRIISAFVEEYPMLRIIMRLIRADEIKSTLKHSDAGLVLSTINVEADNIQSVKLFEEDMYLIVSHDHALASRDGISIEELKKERFALTPTNTAFRVIMDDLFKKAGYKPRICLEGYTEQIVQMVISKMAVSVVSKSDHGNLPYIDKLKFIRLTDDYCKRAIYLLTKAGVPLLENEQSFYDFAYYEKELYVPELSVENGKNNL